MDWGSSKRRHSLERPFATGHGGIDNIRPKRRRFLPPPDEHCWLKYGHKTSGHEESSRAYYKCALSRSGCPAKKTVDFPNSKDGSIHVSYHYQHNHKCVFPAPEQCTVTATEVTRQTEDTPQQQAQRYLRVLPPSLSGCGDSTSGRGREQRRKPASPSSLDDASSHQNVTPWHNTASPALISPPLSSATPYLTDLSPSPTSCISQVKGLESLGRWHTVADATPMSCPGGSSEELPWSRGTSSTPRGMTLRKPATLVGNVSPDSGRADPMKDNVFLVREALVVELIRRCLGAKSRDWLQFIGSENSDTSHQVAESSDGIDLSLHL